MSKRYLIADLMLRNIEPSAEAALANQQGVSVERVTNLKLLSLLPDSTMFLAGSMLVYGVVYWDVPTLTASGIDPMVAWMALAVPCIFLPMIAWGLVRA